jgi:hypothetical protein
MGSGKEKGGMVVAAIIFCFYSIMTFNVLLTKQLNKCQNRGEGRSLVTQCLPSHYFPLYQSFLSENLSWGHSLAMMTPLSQKCLCVISLDCEHPRAGTISCLSVSSTYPSPQCDENNIY